MAPWRIWIDTGGTFTDGIAISPDGEQRRIKILSTSALRGSVAAHPSPRRLILRTAVQLPGGLLPGFRFRLLDREHPERRVLRHEPGDGSVELDGPLEPRAPRGAAFEVQADVEAPVLAARLLTADAVVKPVSACRLRLATTLGTNALLQRSGVATALFITRGFADLLAIGTQQRSDLFRLRIDPRRPLNDAVVEVDERIDARGEIVRPLEIDPLRRAAVALLERGVRVAAVALMHGYLNPSHERRLGRLLLEWGFEHVSRSSELAPRIKLLPRAQTAVADAYLAPVVRGYLDRVRSALRTESLLVLSSAGGLLDADGYRPKDSLLSGPAGGVVGAALAGRRCGQDRIISFDMGGTSTDVARFDGDYEYLDRHHVGDIELIAPALAIESVAAGGGSICWLDGERLRVGPQSAGARPGPACYGAGGPLTVTDVNLLLGRLDAQRFEIPVRADAARARFDELRDELTRRTGEPAPREALLEGLLEIADETMADAIRRVSLRRGYDPADYALVAFGGAGGQHACAVAERLGMDEAIVPFDAPLLSALGLGHAVVERFVERQVLEPLETAHPRLTERFDAMAREAVEAVIAAGVGRERVRIRRRTLRLRFTGQEAGLEIDWTAAEPVDAAFATKYRELFGHQPERRAVELESMRVVASSELPASPASRATLAPAEPRPARVARSARVSFGGTWQETAIHERESLAPGSCLHGPALILERHGATVVAPRWRATVGETGDMVLKRRANGESTSKEGRRPEAIRLELFTQRFYTLVREMGERLERTAVSTNVKERLDFSCALIDPRGHLVVNAPHIPVHLGALGLCVRRVRDVLSMRAGDVIVTNHPRYGGSHLPDITVITPVFDETGDERLLGYVASRAHHAEIGGSRPGSMPPDAKRLAEEGVVIPPLRVIERGRARWQAVREVLESAAFPTRNVEDNLADLRAAVAANHAGAEALRSLVGRHGAETIERYMIELQELAERRMREALREIPDGEYRAVERLDDGTPLAARIAVSGDRARIDFSGTGQVHRGNLNATPAIVCSVVLYVLRSLLRKPLPLNEGLLRAVTIDIPRGLLDPEFPDDPLQAPAVVGGNVETSQRLVDTLFKALGVVACSQGTMNNVVFGNRGYGYYETLGGGSGAGPDFDGASAVHSHMTNTRITDPEVLEHRYPVRAERFAVRRGSGGAGRFRGGDGLVREILFLEPASLTVLTQHRREGPYGMAGGQPGRPGRQYVARREGQTRHLDSADGCEVDAGDRLVVETPGGGGYGEAE